MRIATFLLFILLNFSCENEKQAKQEQRIQELEKQIEELSNSEEIPVEESDIIEKPKPPVREVLKEEIKEKYIPKFGKLKLNERSGGAGCAYKTKPNANDFFADIDAYVGNLTIKIDDKLLEIQNLGDENKPYIKDGYEIYFKYISEESDGHESIKTKEQLTIIKGDAKWEGTVYGFCGA